ncbi:lipoyl(octanoyl) transferase LipB [Gottschalkia acidurici 9a]|uniref:Octanoyltransferase n=1 Tax=Gottschalkia acidurici (strain ATCC 7906 / DSM 604 / BCRC 14475 / CIP 104303 / KCTC 5404 / NCIMB 10678 / 9a) TaxID=1128398 RepID=K0AV67_GOTA9|nr:lipoyl(octanoyl) transferase LipB [Gottschalkia acidurici]AFS77159.1 lipoyl(octanoyl) transferase LipB [Gottschalkia acidurici 9a]
MELNVLSLGKYNYEKSLELQFDLLKKRQEDKIKDTLILVEHPHVITLGKNAHKENILVSGEHLKKNGIDLVEINRGGDVTYHGPGQIVGYPIINIKEKKMGIKDFVSKLEEVFIALLNEKYGIIAIRDNINNGVWVDKNKIVALGLAVKRWVTMHGFAFNVGTDLNFFNLIVPCGVQGRGVTTVEKLTGKEVDLEQEKSDLLRYFIEIFNYTSIKEVTIDDLEV